MNKNIKLPSNLKPGMVIDIEIAKPCEMDVKDADGNPAKQILDKTAFSQIIENEQSDGVRVDVDHKSEISGDTRAAGWINGLYLDGDDLHGMFEVNEYGAQLLNDKQYRFGSPAFRVGEDGRPVSMSSFALTNRPRLDTALIFNMEDTPDVEEAETDENPKDDLNKGMNEIKTILGLGEDATDEEVKASIQALLDSAKAVAEEKAKAEAEEAKKQADDAVADAIDDEEERAKLAEVYNMSPEVAQPFLDYIKNHKHVEQTVLNMSEADDPVIVRFSEEEYNKLSPQERIDYVKSHR